MSELPAFDGRVVDEPVKDQFDFWVGEWDVTSTAGEDLAGHNSVRWVLDGAALQEDFSGGDDPFAGRSLSVPVAGRGWVQTWVDNTGAYLDFEGGWVGDRMVLERATHGGARQRMTWHSIAPDRLVWDWAACPAGEQAWVLNWQLAYSRMAANRGHDEGLSSGWGDSPCPTHSPVGTTGFEPATP